MAINIQQQQELLLAIAQKIPRPITVYAIGGTAMMFQGTKLVTLDIDLVFTKKEDRELFKEVAQSLGYKEDDTKVVYGRKQNAPVMIKIGEARLDLFTRDILGVKFSDAMIQRAGQIHEFSQNLIIRIANINDIIIMKSTTERAKDEEDIISLLKSGNVNWPILIEEAKNQVQLGNIKAILHLGYLLEKVSNKGKFFIPKNVLDKLWSLLKKQRKKK